MDRFLDRSSATIAYDIEGPDRGPALIATHEPTGSRADEDAWGAFDWSAVPASGVRLVRYDTRGHGRSTGGVEPADYRWPALAADLLALADTVSPDAPVDLLGVATGCGTVLQAATTAPHRVRRLVLVVPPAVGAARDRQVELFRAAADLAEVRGIDAWTRAATAMPPVPVLQEGGWHRRERPSVPEELLPLVVRGQADSVFPSDAVLAGLTQEVLILAWTDDPSHPVDGAERLAALLPGARLEVATDVPTVAAWGRRIAELLTEETAGAERD
ncbi:MAG TPA: alpha/beta fold hydrolase [Amnibacterium sp.]|jgi:pimeloyl-ACP methyl ester carboxylesterase|uniref:alpha/beta fold hydrolase n=1 Tax=Amnibacterium sp. TaxID=1872496 RepID=UPI002F9319B2